MVEQIVIQGLKYSCPSPLSLSTWKNNLLEIEWMQICQREDLDEGC